MSSYLGSEWDSAAGRDDDVQRISWTEDGDIAWTTHGVGGRGGGGEENLGSGTEWRDAKRC